MDHEDLLVGAARSIHSIGPALAALETAPELRRVSAEAAGRPWLRPDDEAELIGWFARYLTLRSGLLETIHDLRPALLTAMRKRGEGASPDLPLFVVGWTAACLLVRGARHLVGVVAADAAVQRMLDAPSREHRIPAGQVRAVHASLTAPRNLWRLHGALQYADAHRVEIQALADDDCIGSILPFLLEAEPTLRVGVPLAVRARARYRWLQVRAVPASSYRQAVFGILEGSGRLFSRIRWPWHVHRVRRRTRHRIERLLKPGDVLLTRHEDALTNLFMPGWWPHASLYIGGPGTRAALGIETGPGTADRWRDDRCVLEARKDGVLLRSLADTLSVDAVTVLRPLLDETQVAEGIGRGLTHEGKLYNFDFDFTTSERLVCTEVVYRSYDGIGPIRFQLSERGGRPTLSAEDLLAMALRGDGFKPVAVFGAPGSPRRLRTGVRAAAVLGS